MIRGRRRLVRLRPRPRPASALVIPPRDSRAARHDGSATLGLMPRSHARLIVALAVSCQQGNAPGDAPDLGALSMPSVVVGRDGGSAAMIGGQMLWTFNDTLMKKTGADGFNYRSATAAWGTGASTSITDTLDANGAPFQLVPYTADELAFNSANGPSQRYAMWPDAVVAN